MNKNAIVKCKTQSLNETSSFVFKRTSFIIYSLSFITALLFTLGIYAQNIYPLSLTTQLVPPYSSRIADYAAPGNEKLRIIAFQRDLTQPSYRFFLRMEISVNGKVLFRTSGSWMPNPGTISPGVPTIFNGTDLQPYFDINHLEFVNYSRDQYLSNPNLPEGFTTICFTAYDYSRPDVAVSQQNCSNYYLTLPQPPVLNYPACGTQVLALQPQQMLFSWTPMNMGNNASATTVFEFSLYENRDNRNPNDAVQNLAPVYTTQTSANTIVYGPAEPALQDSMQYVWRVQAIDQTGSQAFVNNGYSQPCSFWYVPNSVFNWNAVQPLQVYAQAMNETNAKIGWRPDNTMLYNSYKVQYRKSGNSAYSWFSNITADTTFFVSQLEPNTRYETQVAGIKGNDTGQLSKTVVFTTPARKTVSCNASPTILAAYNGKPYTNAIKGDMVHYGNFDVTLNRVTPNPATPGWYSGTGSVIIPFMANIELTVHFDNIQVDDAMQVTAGEIIFDSQDINEWANSVPTVSQVVKEILADIKSLLQKYDGSEADKKAIAEAHIQINRQYDSLQNSLYLTQQEKDSLAAIHKNTESCWKALEEGKPCDSTVNTTGAAQNADEHGPYVVKAFTGPAANYDCYTQKAEAERNAIESLNDKAAERSSDIQCQCRSSKDASSTSCEIIKKILTKIKEGSGEQIMRITTNIDGSTKQSINKTFCLQIGNEQIKQFEIVFFVDAMTREDNTTYSTPFNKNDLKDYADNAANQRGLEHFNSKGKSDIMLLIDEPDDATFTRQRDALKRYLGISENTALKTGSYTITLDKMEDIFSVSGKQLENMKAILPYLNTYMADWGINSDIRLAYLLSQIGPETGNFKNFDEKDDGKYSNNAIKSAFTESQLTRCDDIDSYVKDPNNPEKLFNCMYCCEDGNGVENSGDGYRFRGRGLIQLTHRGSYRRFTAWYNENYKGDYQNFETNPDLLNQPKYATLSAIWEFCVDKNANNRVFNAISKDDKNSINRIGGWINGKNPPNGSDERISVLNRAKETLK